MIVALVVILGYLFFGYVTFCYVTTYENEQPMFHAIIWPVLLSLILMLFLLSLIDELTKWWKRE
jgi:hypothetical protein